MDQQTQLFPSSLPENSGFELNVAVHRETLLQSGPAKSLEWGDPATILPLISVAQAAVEQGGFVLVHVAES